MVDLPSLPNEIPQLRAPVSRVSPADIAAPYNQLATTLDKAGDVLMKDVAIPAAREAGMRAVTRDEDGNIQVQRVPIFGDAAAEFSRAVKFSAVAEAEGELKRADIKMRSEYRDNPDGYLKAAEAYRKTQVDKFSNLAGAEVGITLGKIIDTTTTQTWRGLQNEHENLTLQRADKTMQAGAASAREDLITMARGGVTAGPAWEQSLSKYRALTEERVNNPRLAYPREQAEYDLQHLEGELRANGFLYHIDQVYKDRGVGPDGTSRGGAGPALEAAKSVLTDTSLKLTPQQREAYYHKAVGEVRANEAIRRQDVQEARAAASELNQAAALGLRIDPEQVDHVADVFRKAGDPAGAARLYASFARKPLNDDFGRQPIEAQTEQLQRLRSGAARGTPEQVQSVAAVATRLGVAPRDLAAAISYETGGTFDMNVKGGKGGRYLGLIQFGPEEQAKYGVKPGMTFEQQMGAVEAFLRDRGVKPGMGLPEIYRTINGGNPNASLTASDGNGTIAQHIQRIQGGHYGNADLFLGASGDPASTAWLTANRQRTVQTTARTAWATIEKDYDAKGVRPANETIDQVITAARASNDADLLDRIANGVEKMDVSRRLSQSDLPTQHAALTQLRQAGDAGILTPGQAGVLKDLERRNKAITDGLEDNPIQTAVTNFSDRFKVPAPLDLSNDQAFAAGLQYRAKVAEFARQNWRTGALPALDKADLAQVQAALDTPDMAVKARIFGAINTLPEDVRNATLEKIGAKGPEAMTQVMAGALLREAPDVAQSILRGQAAMKADKRNDPFSEGEKKATVNEALDAALPSTAFSIENRTDPKGAYATMRAAVIARYADLTAQDPAGKHEFSETRLRQAANDVTGGVLTLNGSKFIAPKRGMTQPQFDGVLWSLKDRDLSGMTTASGTPITVDYLRAKGRLESVGEGRYQVQLGGNQLKPIYAFKLDPSGAETPRVYVLDLRGRATDPQQAFDPFASDPSLPGADVGF